MVWETYLLIIILTSLGCLPSLKRLPTWWADNSISVILIPVPLPLMGLILFIGLLVKYISSSCPPLIFILCGLSCSLESFIINLYHLLSFELQTIVHFLALFMASCHVDIFNFYRVKYAHCSFRGYGFTVLFSRTASLKLHLYSPVFSSNTFLAPFLALGPLFISASTGCIVLSL